MDVPLEFTFPTLPDVRYSHDESETRLIPLIHCQGQRNRKIADGLFVSLQTVKDHLYRIYQKLDVRNRVELFDRIRGARP